MPIEVSIREGESQDWLLRRFQGMVQVSGIMRDARAHHYFLPKQQASRLKAKKTQEESKAAANPLISSCNLIKGALI